VCQAAAGRAQVGHAAAVCVRREVGGEPRGMEPEMGTMCRCSIGKWREIVGNEVRGGMLPVAVVVAAHRTVLPTWKVGERDIYEYAGPSRRGDMAPIVVRVGAPRGGSSKARKQAQADGENIQQAKRAAAAKARWQRRPPARFTL